MKTKRPTKCPVPNRPHTGRWPRVVVKEGRALIDLCHDLRLRARLFDDQHVICKTAMYRCESHIEAARKPQERSACFSGRAISDHTTVFPRSQNLAPGAKIWRLINACVQGAADAIDEARPRPPATERISHQPTRGTFTRALALTPRSAPGTELTTLGIMMYFCRPASLNAVHPCHFQSKHTRTTFLVLLKRRYQPGDFSGHNETGEYKLETRS